MSICDIYTRNSSKSMHRAHISATKQTTTKADLLAYNDKSAKNDRALSGQTKTERYYIYYYV